MLEVGGRWGGLNFRITEWAVVRLRKIERKCTPLPGGGPATGAARTPFPSVPAPTSHSPAAATEQG